MKKVLLLLVAFSAALTSQACIKKSPSQSADTIVCFVMDSTKALIGNALIQYNKQSVRTDWSGRVLLPVPEDGLKIAIQAEGYKSLNTKVSNAQSFTIIYLEKAKDSVKKTGSSAKGGHIAYRTLGAKHATIEEVAFDGMPVATEMSYAVMTGLPKIESTLDEEVGYVPNIQPGAGKLTAGEVNDFAKWALWKNVLDSSHHQYISDWKMTATERYTVQVVNKQHYPMAGRQVSLVSKNGTVFQAITDNYGRAELWNGLTGEPCQGELFITVDDQRIKAEKGLSVVETEEVCDAQETTEIMFVMDATGSMGDELRYMTAELKDVIARSEHAVEGVTIRTGALVYRDHGDEYLTRISRLTEDLNETQRFLDAQQAQGGGDYEEAIPEALMATIHAAGWSNNARTRIAFLIFDAPCHKDSATIQMLHEQVLNAAAMGIRLVPIVCSGLRESGELLARTMALVTNGTSFFLTDDSGIGGSHLKPTTDTLKVEHLNDMLVRTIIEFSRMPNCDNTWQAQAMEDDAIESFVPNPTDAPSAHSAGKITIKPNPCSGLFVAGISEDAEMICLVDATGKSIHSLGAHEAGEIEVKVGSLATGVYFLKALINGQWHTAKVIIL